MFRVLHASHNGHLYKSHVRGVGDIADLVREWQLESLTSADGEIDFWFTPSTHQQINRNATEIFLRTSTFGAANVPLLRGIVVLATHSSDGELTGLTEDQMGRLIDARDSTTWRQDQVLSVRYARDRRHRRRAAAAAAECSNASTSWLIH